MNTTLLEGILLRIDIFLLLFVRMMGLFATAPVWSNRVIPVQLRVALAMGCALVVSPLFREVPLPATFVSLVALAIRELLVGMVIGFVAVIAFAAIQFAGQMLDVNMGLSMINVLDPMSGTQMPVVGNFLYILSLLIFFSINGHHMLLNALMDSYVLVPLGTAVVSTDLANQVVVIGANMFIIGLKVAAPVLAALFLTTIALGILNRAIPQMNVFVVGTPVQLAVGVFMLAVVMPLYVSFLQVIFRGMSTDIMSVLRLMKG